MNQTFTCSKEDELATVAPQILALCGLRRVVALAGGMGAGKTALTKALCRTLGVTENVSSPTFALVNEYRDAAGKPVFHFDFYRIQSLQEAMDIGVDEYFYSGSFCFVEWPEKILNLLPEDTVHVTIGVDDGIRLISVYNE
jgi:tRNA threonylcarbamoyladenosine biosynthesis protein TsaE